MSLNQFLPVATGDGANALTPAQYAALGVLAQGFQSGVLPSVQFNTVLRQVSTVTAALGQFTADNQSADVLDDGVVSNFESKFGAAIKGLLSSSLIHYGVASGTGDAMVVTAIPPMVATTAGGYAPGSVLFVKTPGSPNATTAPTVNANSIGNIAITKPSSSALAVGDNSASTWITLFFDGTNCDRVGLTASDVQALIPAQVTPPPQSALLHVGTDNSTNAATITATVTPAVTTRQTDLAYLITPAHACAGATQINVGFGLEPMTRKDGSALQANDYAAGQPLLVVDDGANFRVLSGLRLGVTNKGGLAVDGNGNLLLGLLTNLTADTRSAPVAADVLPLGRLSDGLMVGVSAAALASYVLSNIIATETFPQIVVTETLYIRSDGNDSNGGAANTPGGAFATLGAAFAKGGTAFAAGQVVYQIGIPGTYACPPTFPHGTGLSVIQGDPANPQNYIISGAGSSGTGVFNANGVMQTNGVTIQNTGTVSPTLACSPSTSSITLFNTVVTSTTSGNGNPHLEAISGQITIANGCSMSGNMGSYLNSTQGGQISLAPGVNIPVVGNPTVSVFASASKAGQITNDGATFSGTAIGQRFATSSNGIIDTAGGGLNYFPGSTAGVVTSPSIYQ